MIFDAHGDILTDVTIKHQAGIDSWNTYHKEKYAKAGVSASIFVNFTDPQSADQRRQFDQITKTAISYFENHPEVQIVRGVEDFTSSKFKAILGIEGMGGFDSADELEALYALGYRHIGITWNEVNAFASGTGYEGGLTSKGKVLIEKCNKLGFILDFAHLNHQSFLEAASVTTKPIFFSHGNVRALSDHIRNLDDHQLELVAKSNGVVGLAAMNFFLNEDKEQATINDVVKHVLYIKDNFGIDHVGFGFDFCYYLGESYQNNVEGLKHIDDVRNLVDKFEAAGLSKDEIEKVCYKNMLRVITEHLTNA